LQCECHPFNIFRRGIAGNTALTGNTINVRDAYSDPRFYNAIDDQTGYRTRTVLAVAVRNQHGEIIGAFETLNKRTGTFSARDEESLIALASHAAIAIETAQLIGELRRNQDELTQQNAHLWREVENRYATHGIIGTGQRIQQIVRLVERIRDSVVNVLITGESGTGKELIAKALHYNSPRARRSTPESPSASPRPSPLQSVDAAGIGPKGAPPPLPREKQLRW
jgi:Nif-specific regulatory protein